MFFSLKTSSSQRGIIPQNFSSLGFAVSEELGNKQTNNQTDSLTDWRFYRVIDLDTCTSFKTLKKKFQPAYCRLTGVISHRWSTYFMLKSQFHTALGYFPKEKKFSRLKFRSSSRRQPAYRAGGVWGGAPSAGGSAPQAKIFGFYAGYAGWWTPKCLLYVMNLNGNTS